MNPRLHPDLTIIHLYDDEFALWLARDASALQDVKDAVLITDPQLGQSQQLMKLLAKRKVVFRRTVESTDLELIAQLTAAGAGVGLLPARVAERNRGLVRLGSAMPTIRDRHCLVFRTDAQRSPASRLLTRHMVQWIRGTAKHS